MQTIELAHLHLKPEHRLLDLGCGQGRHALAAYWLAPAEQVIALDIDAEDLGTARSRQQDFPQENPAKTLHWLRGDALHLPFADASFDAVICSEVLEHIHNHRRVLDEIARILKPGGHLAVSVPRAWPERICWWLSRAYHQVEGGHIRIFNARQLRHQITERGLIFTRRHWAHALHVPYWWLRCLFWSHGEHFVPVRLYHRLLVWDLLHNPWITRTLERLLNPLMGKSVVLYFEKPLQSRRSASD